jgi:hypothetical protein
MRAPSTRETTPTSRCESIRCGSCATHTGFTDEPPKPPGSGGFLVAGTPSATRHRCATSGVPQTTCTRVPAGVPATPDARGTRDGCRAAAGRPPDKGRPILLQRCPAPARATRRTQWKRPPEVAETPSRTKNATRHRRAASRSGGATSAECNGRPVHRRTEFQRQRRRQAQRQQTARAPSRSRIPDTAPGRGVGHGRGRRGEPRWVAEKRVQGRWWRSRFSPSRVAEPVTAERGSAGR